MLFVEFRFILFFLAVFGVYWSLRGNGARKILLLAASYFFYGCWDWRFLFLIAFSTTVDFFVGHALERAAAAARRRRWLLLSLGVNLGLLGVFKYYNFFTGSARDGLVWLGLHPRPATLRLILPVGISFFTFQSLSYTIDVYRGHLRPVRRYLDLALAVSFFPQLVAGPITRAADFLPQLDRLRRFEEVNVKAFLVLFLGGFIKKACLSDVVASGMVDPFFQAPERYGLLSSFLGVGFYAVQIYCDFSGYTDMALACAGLLGYRLAQNFDFPYFADNVGDFWRRWHTSLSSWLRDYLYVPLGGNRGGRIFVARNLMVTMLLGGLWHGAAWNFLGWGGLHGIALVVHRRWRQVHPSHRSQPRPDARAGSGRPVWWTVPATLLTFYWVCLCWIFFRAPNLRITGAVLRPFLLLQAGGTARFAGERYWAALFLVLALIHWLNHRRFLAGRWERWPNTLFAVGYGVAVGAVLLFIPPHYAPFIYFQF